MTVDQLLVEARQNMIEPRPPMTQEHLLKALRMLLEALLDGLDYEGKPSSAPAFFARAIATIVADLEDRDLENRKEVLQ